MPPSRKSPAPFCCRRLRQGHPQGPALEGCIDLLCINALRETNGALEGAKSPPGKIAIGPLLVLPLLFLSLDNERHAYRPVCARLPTRRFVSDRGRGVSRNIAIC